MYRYLRRLAPIAALFFLSSCSPELRNIRPTPLVGPPRPDFPIPTTVVLRTFDAPSEKRLKEERYHVAVDWARNLRDFWSTNDVFREAEYIGADTERADFLVKGSVTQHWDHNSSSNFLIAFPGGFVLLPIFVGFEYAYGADARVTFYDAKKLTKIKDYTASVNFVLLNRELRSADFALYNFLIFPGVIFAYLQMEAHSSYRQTVYEKAHDLLWDQITAQIVADRALYGSTH